MLTDARLKRLGVPTLGQRRRILAMAAALPLQPPSPIADAGNNTARKHSNGTCPGSSNERATTLSCTPASGFSNRPIRSSRHDTAGTSMTGADMRLSDCAGEGINDIADTVFRHGADTGLKDDVGPRSTAGTKSHDACQQPQVSHQRLGGQQQSVTRAVVGGPPQRITDFFTPPGARRPLAVFQPPLEGGEQFHPT